jgi:GNAT superfamily N-acetyltransferase
VAEFTFCGTELAGRIERAETQLISAGTEAARRRNPGAAFVRPLAGGAACFAEDGSPFNKVVGLGFSGVPGEQEFDEIERAYAGRVAPTQVELANLADPGIGLLVTGRGYRLVAFENVLGRSLEGVETRAAQTELDVRLSTEDELDAWAEVVTTGFAHPDEQGVPAFEEFPREIVERAERDFVAAGAQTYVAVRDGVVAGGASMRMTDGVAQLTGAATAPAHRRRGVQTALLAARLSDAAKAGCDIAVVTTAPGSKSQQNVQRQGFALLYTRAVLVRDTE